MIQFADRINKAGTIAALCVAASLAACASNTDKSAAPVTATPAASFKAADLNRDGKVDRDEFNRVILDQFSQQDLNGDGTLSGNELTPAERENLDQVDTNDDGRIDKLEYQIRQSQLFNDADSDSDGFLTPLEYNQWRIPL